MPNPMLKGSAYFLHWLRFISASIQNFQRTHVETGFRYGLHLSYLVPLDFFHRPSVLIKLICHFDLTPHLGNSVVPMPGSFRHWRRGVYFGLLGSTFDFRNINLSAEHKRRRQTNIKSFISKKQLQFVPYLSFGNSLRCCDD